MIAAYLSERRKSQLVLHPIGGLGLSYGKDLFRVARSWAFSEVACIRLY